jgi:hypothetical protein
VDLSKYRNSFNNRDYAYGKGKYADYYITTAKLANKKYELTILEDKDVIYKDEHIGLKQTKFEAFKWLLNYKADIFQTKKVVMVHYIEDRGYGNNGWTNDSNKDVLKHLNEYLANNTERRGSLPPLIPSNRSREYSIYNKYIDTIVYEYLFNSRTHRWLDEMVIGISADNKTGHESMNVLHYIGLRDIHKGIFSGKKIEEAITLLEQQSSEFGFVIDCLNRFNISKELVEVVTNDIDSEKAEDETYYSDGAIREYYGKRYERNPENRKKAIDFHGLNCTVCNFNFEYVYGDRGRDFIEVHHVKPLSTLDEEMIIDPQSDLVPICSNCHRMIHRRKDNVLTIEELKLLVSKNKNSYEVK